MITSKIRPAVNCEWLECKSDKGGEVFASITKDKKLIAHTWLCEGEGKQFLKYLEDYAKAHNLRFQICNIMSDRMLNFVKNNGFKSHFEFIEEVGEHCDFWERVKEVKK